MPHPVDIAAGLNMRRLRRSRRISQEALAEKIGLTFQQVQKYERGANRMSCSRLVDIARALNVSPLAILPRTDWLEGEDVPHWVEDIEGLYRRHTGLFEALTQLSPRQVHGLYVVADAILRPHDEAVKAP